MRATVTAVWASIAVALAACTPSEQPRLYTLTTITEPEVLQNNLLESQIGIGPVTLPQYLDRQQIVQRQSPYRLNFSEFDRWAEPLSDTVPRLLAGNVSKLLANEHVYVLPRRRRTPIDLTVEVDITRFEPLADGSAALMANWSIYADTDMPVGGGTADLTVQDDVASDGVDLTPTDAEDSVRLLSKALERLSQQIAGSLASLEGT